MKKKLTAADMHNPQVIAETPWFSMRKVGIDVAPGERRDFYSIHYPRPAVGIVALGRQSAADSPLPLSDR